MVIIWLSSFIIEVLVILPESSNVESKILVGFLEDLFKAVVLFSVIFVVVPIVIISVIIAVVLVLVLCVSYFLVGALHSKF